MKDFDVVKSIAAQKELCKTKKLPHFAPHSGICWSCGQNIYKESPIREYEILGQKKQYTSGITVEKASKELVTGCPHCNRSYCD